MIIAIIYVVISFLIDGIVSNYTSINLVDPSYLRTIYTVISLVIIYHYFENQKKYLYITIITGIIFDIVYTNTFLLNVFIFLIIYIILNLLDYLISNNIFTINIKSIITIIIYHVLTYIILLMVNYNDYTIDLLFTIIVRSIIMTIIYTTISYILFKKIYEKIDNRKIK